MNHTSLHARIEQISSLRYTPAGVPIIHMQLAHQSCVTEAGQQRRLEFDIQAVALGPLAEHLAQLEAGSELRAQGFLAPLRQNSRQLVLHIQQLD